MSCSKRSPPERVDGLGSGTPWVCWAEGLPWGVGEVSTVSVVVMAAGSHQAAIRAAGLLERLYGADLSEAHAEVRVRAEGDRDEQALRYRVLGGYAADQLHGSPSRARVV